MGSGAHLGWADGLAELAGDAALLPGRVPAQRMLATEARAQWALLKWVVDGGWLSEQVAQGHAQAWGRHRHGGRGPSSLTHLCPRPAGLPPPPRAHLGRARSTAGSELPGRSPTSCPLRAPACSHILQGRRAERPWQQASHRPSPRTPAQGDEAWPPSRCNSWAPQGFVHSPNLPRLSEHPRGQPQALGSPRQLLPVPVWPSKPGADGGWKGLGYWGPDEEAQLPGLTPGSSLLVLHGEGLRSHGVATWKALHPLQ